MLISIDWINEFSPVPTGLTPKQVGERFTMATAEVEGVESVGDHFEKITIAEIVEIEKHPEADKLNLVTFKVNGDETRRVVCGASNVRVGLKTPYAKIGITLPGGFTLEPKKIRGILSEGMLCSEEELGTADTSAGIMELPEDALVGMTMLEFLSEKKDVILDVDNKSLTHRPDLWGHYGIAREFSAIFNNDLKSPFSESWKSSLKEKFSSADAPMKVNVDLDSSCLSYYGLSVDGVEVTDSPSWMKRRLLAVGLRPINNIVDISNYVMLELGIPLHIFDRDQIKGDCVNISKLNKEDSFITLDEVERKLIPSDTVISDSEKPLVIAGLMGGLSSGVSDKTTKIFIETANWKAAEVRSTSTRLGLRTDSSQRYEKTLDSQLLERTILRTLELILELCPKASVQGALQYGGVELASFSPLVIKTSPEKIVSVLGHEVEHSEIKRIFTALDFNIDSDWNVTVPSYRSTKDIECEADLIEEIGRVVGYDNITPSSPLLGVSPVKLSEAQKLHRGIRDFMVLNTGSYELMTYPMIGKKLYDKSSWELSDDLELINALSKDQSIMRPSMIPSLLEVAAKNIKNYEDFRVFELGRTYHSNEKNFSEEKSKLVIAFYKKEATPFMELVNTVESLGDALNLPIDICEKHPKFKNEIVSEDWAGVHPFEFLNIRIMGKMKGVITTVHPIVARAFKIKGHLSIAEIDLSGFEARPLKDKTKYSPLAQFPSSSFDWSVVANKDEPVGKIIEALRKVKIKEMKSVKIADVFSLEDGTKSVTLKATFLDPEKTLDGDLLTSAREKLVSTLESAGYPLKS